MWIVYLLVMSGLEEDSSKVTGKVFVYHSHVTKSTRGHVDSLFTCHEWIGGGFFQSDGKSICVS
jgi:hypothetical protein